MMIGVTVTAQDVITTKDGADIQAKILEITQTEVKYKKQSNPEGPTYTINKSDVLIIRYNNGEKDIFKDAPEKNDYKPNTNKPIVEGMRFSEYKDLYDRKMYVHQPGDPYNPGVAGVLSFLIPGLGQGIDDEWGRGIIFTLGYVGIGALACAVYDEHDPTPSIIVSSLAIVLNIWNIADAINVAKIKNMYNQDVRRLRMTQVDCTLSPFVSKTPDLGTGSHAFAGLSFSLTF